MIKRSCSEYLSEKILKDRKLHKGHKMIMYIYYDSLNAAFEEDQLEKDSKIHKYDDERS